MENVATRSFAKDRISHLPDCLLHHILSLLDTKQAVCTGILSNRWKNLWKSTLTLDFHQHYKVEEDDNEEDDEAAHQEERNFVSFVERSLLLHLNPKIQKFRLSFKYSDQRYGPCVDAWILFAIARDVQELYIDFFESNDSYKVPSCLFSCEKLVSLRLKKCLVKAPKSVHFTSLTALSIWETHFNGCLLEPILAGCPLLEDLVMVRCFFDVDRRICICSSSPDPSGMKLKRFTMIGCRNSGLKVEAPRLEFLKVAGFAKCWYSLKCGVALKEVDLNLVYFQIGADSAFPAVSISDLRHAKVLKLSSTCIQVSFQLGVYKNSIQIENQSEPICMVCFGSV